MQGIDPGHSSFPSSTGGLHTAARAGTCSWAAVPGGRTHGPRGGGGAEREWVHLQWGWMQTEEAQSRDRWWGQAGWAGGQVTEAMHPRFCRGMQGCMEGTQSPSAGGLEPGPPFSGFSFPVGSYSCSDSGVWVHSRLCEVPGP